MSVLVFLRAQSRPITASDIRRGTNLPHSNVRTALVQLSALVDEGMPVIQVTPHESLTYNTADGPKPVYQYQLTEIGRAWSDDVNVARARRPRSRWLTVPVPIGAVPASALPPGA